VSAFFHKYGMDSTGHLPYEVFAVHLLEARSRRIALEPRRTGAFKVDEDFKFRGRIKYAPCRKEVFTPNNWDGTLAHRSAKPPKAGLSLDFVYGYGGIDNTAPNLFYTDTGKVVYYVAAVGIVYDIAQHTQQFFHGHDDDIKCLAIHPDRHIVASGQVASTSGPPYVCIWDTTEVSDGQGGTCLKGLVQQIPFPDANGSSNRAVIAVAFSPNKEGPQRLVCVTSNNDHTVWVFNWQRPGGRGPDGARAAWPPCELMCTCNGGKGTPPYVWGINWNPFSLNPNTQTKGVAEFVTFGVKHVKMWRLCKDMQNPRAYYGVQGKPGIGEAGKFGSCQGMVPEDVLSAQFVPCGGGLGQAAKSMLVTGARSGALYIWSLERGLECRRVVRAHEPGPLIPTHSGMPGEAALGGVRCLHLKADSRILLSGGSDGRVLPWAIEQLTGRSPEQGLITSEVCQLGAPSNPPSIRALDSRAWSDVYVAGTHSSDVWEVDRTPEPVIYGHAGDVNAVCFHPSTPSWFVTASDTQRVFIWDAHKRCLLAKRNVRRAAKSVDFSPDGTYSIYTCTQSLIPLCNLTFITVPVSIVQVLSTPEYKNSKKRYLTIPIQSTPIVPLLNLYIPILNLHLHSIYSYSVPAPQEHCWPSAAGTGALWYSSSARSWRCSPARTTHRWTSSTARRPSRW
jgi:WD40 repeat protein